VRDEENSVKLRGWIYVIENRAMPGLVKIGFSTKDPALRAIELGGTGVPHRFSVVFDVLVLEPRDVERQVHRKLEAVREGKEWFRISATEAIQTVRSCAAGSMVLASERSSASASTATPRRAKGQYRCSRCSLFWNEEDFDTRKGRYCPNCGTAVSIWR
jgi:DNA-directed RNA polymerase subunit RPC12/RpoP